MPIQAPLCRLKTIKASTSVAVIPCRPPQVVSFHDQTKAAAMHCLSDEK